MLGTVLLIVVKLFILICGLNVILLSRNPIHSVLNLIGVVLGISFILVALGQEFLGLTLVVVYIGAIVIMFLFVIMMLDVRNIDLASKYNLYMSFVMSTYLVLPIYFFKKFNFKNYMANAIVPQYNWYDWALSLDNIKLVGEVLYKFYHLYIVLGGLLLFVATMGAIILSSSDKT